MSNKIMYKEIIKTDNATYAIVEPSVHREISNIVTHPLIPIHDIRQIDWSVTIGEGAIYNPNEGQGIYGTRVEIGYGSMVRGSVIATNNLIIESGLFTSGTGSSKEGEEAELIKSPTSIFGDVVSLYMFIARPGRKLAGYEPGFIEVLGNLILYDRAEVSAPLIIGGSVFLIGHKDISSNFEYREGEFKIPFFTMGVTYIKSSKVRINAPLSTAMIVLDDADLEVNAPLYLHYPIITGRGNIYVNDKIFVVPMRDILSSTFRELGAEEKIPVNLHYALIYISNILREGALIPMDELNPERDRVKLGEDTFAITNLWRTLNISEVKKIYEMFGNMYW